jgi:hypothetical protein
MAHDKDEWWLDAPLAYSAAVCVILLMALLVLKLGVGLWQDVYGC